MTLAEVLWVLRGCLHLEVCKSDFLEPWPIETFRLTGVGRSWASIGAVVTILSLIYDPFIQGLIKVSERLVYKNNPAALVNRLEKFPFYESRWNPKFVCLSKAFRNQPLT